MNTRLLIVCTLGLWAGSTLVLVEIPWFGRVPLADRLRRYSPGGMTAARRNESVANSLAAILGPMASALGKQLSRVVGVKEDISTRLLRVGSEEDATTFRIREFGYALLTLIGAGLVATAVGLSGMRAIVLIVSAPLAAALIVEQRLADANSQYQRAVLHELPVVAEQLGMLMSAGYSLSASLHRISQRPSGVCARDMRRVVQRIRQGVSEVDSLREWSALAGVDALSRLVDVLALNREAGDLGSMISAESRAMRREVHRELLEEIERRGQMVWIPVTVATLVPGVIFLAIPFTAALNQFAGA